ncbi:MAG: BMP family ABC transporter substrate-binding protein [Anaerolineaceae bacterium]|nr:BMP family ABC transporter substrate-binding protein [Anaerolineaceae bacterium]
MFKKVSILLALVFVLAFVLSACGGGEADCAAEDVFCVGLVTDVGEVDDKSFNQSAWEGVQMAADELGATVEYVETKDAKDYAANIALFADSNYDVIVTVGFGLGDATREAAATYPEIDFIGVDQFQADAIDNVVGLIFPEWKAGFQAGALAAMLNQSGVIAGVYGTDLVPAVVAFGEGFEDGASYIKSDISVITTYHPGGYATGFTDPDWGATTSKQAIEQGADVVFAAGGKTGNGGLKETANYEGLYCIGVDTDQWETVPEAHGCLVSSAMKLIKPGVFGLINMSKDGTFPSGNYFGEVGLASFHDFDSSISQEIKDTLAQINEDLLNDVIVYEDFH